MLKSVKLPGTPVIALLALLGGLILGSLPGSLLQRLYFTRGNTMMYLFSEPVREYAHVRELLVSPDENDRVIGYYAMREYDRTDAPFLVDRFHSEKSPRVKRLIVWLLGFSGNRNEVKSFIKKTYGVSGALVKKEMEKTALRLWGDGLEGIIPGVDKSR